MERSRNDDDLPSIPQDTGMVLEKTRGSAVSEETLYKCNDCHLIFEGHEKAVKHTDKFMSHTIGKVEKETTE